MSSALMTLSCECASWCLSVCPPFWAPHTLLAPHPTIQGVLSAVSRGQSTGLAWTEGVRMKYYKAITSWPKTDRLKSSCCEQTSLPQSRGRPCLVQRGIKLALKQGGSGIPFPDRFSWHRFKKCKQSSFCQPCTFQFTTILFFFCSALEKASVTWLAPGPQVRNTAVSSVRWGS